MVDGRWSMVDGRWSMVRILERKKQSSSQAKPHKCNSALSRVWPYY
ncbi:hypothetical protein [Parendozoicomonas callyspongiae]